MRGEGRQGQVLFKGAAVGLVNDETVIDVTPISMLVEATGDGLFQTQCDSAEKVRIQT